MATGKECFCHGPGVAARHLHHIIPLNGGGVNIRLNLVPLCIDCHTEIHPWMKLKNNKKEPHAKPQ